jgi:hypothetical protein
MPFVTDEFIAEYERVVRDVDRLRAKIDNLNGRGITNDFYSLSIEIPQVQASSFQPPDSLPIGQYQEMVYKMVSQNRAGFGFVMAHGMS